MTDRGLKMKYFVMKPEGKDAYAEASRMAMRTYAICIYSENPTLSKNINRWVDDETDKSYKQ